MFQFLTVSQLFDSVYAENQAAALGVPPQEPKKVWNKWPAPLASQGSTTDWIEAGAPPGMSAAASKPDTGGLTWQETGALVAAIGGATAAVGTVFNVRAEQSKLKTQDLALQHEASLAAIDARRAEADAELALQSGQRQIGAVTATAGAEAGARRATMAGRGVQLGVGSAAEVQASGELIKEEDVMAIRSNAAREAAALRTGAVNQRNRAMFATLSGRNLRRSGGNDFTSAMAGGTSLLYSGSRLGAQWATDRYGGR